MKKFLVSIVAMVLSIPTFAQYSSGGFSLDESSVYYGVRLGVNFASLNADIDTKGRTGLSLGGVIGLRVSDTTPVFVESGLYYTEKGGKFDASPLADTKCHYNALQVPVVIKYGIKTSEVAILPFIGPYFAWGVSGNYQYASHFDMGIKLGCGIEYNMLYLEGAYEFGIKNRADEDKLTSVLTNVKDPSLRNGAFVINFGVNF